MGSYNKKAQLLTTRDPIAEALFGTTRQAVLRMLLGHADQRFYQQQIMRELSLGHGAVQRELRRLTSGGILTRCVEGRQTYYQANRQCPVFKELHGLVQKTFGVAGVLRVGLAPLADRVRLAFIYGSVAKGEESASSDVDVMIVGEGVSLREAVSALSDAQAKLSREVNPTVYTTQEFCDKLARGHHFIVSVVAEPKIFIIGDERELSRLAEIGVAQKAPTKSKGNRRTVRPSRP